MPCSTSLWRLAQDLLTHFTQHDTEHEVNVASKKVIFKAAMLRSLSGLAARPPLSSSVPTLPLLRTAAIMGKACVLRWAEMKNLECCSEDVISQISILESIQAAGLAATARASQQAAHSAQRATGKLHCSIG